MRFLVACERSGVVRDALIRAGHDAFSNDLEGIDPEGDYTGQHLYGDARWFLTPPYRWDALIAFPPCTDLAVSGARYFAEKRRDGRQARALELVRDLLNADVPRIALENPVGVISTAIRKPDQIIHPWQFGHAESKTTCLWLKGLPPLTAKHVLEPPRVVDGRARWENQTDSGQNRMSPSPRRPVARGRTYPGIAAAMAAQWGAVA